MMCLDVFGIETMSCTCVAVNFGSQVCTGVTFLKLKDVLALCKKSMRRSYEIPDQFQTQEQCHVQQSHFIPLM